MYIFRPILIEAARQTGGRNANRQINQTSEHTNKKTRPLSKNENKA